MQKTMRTFPFVMAVLLGALIIALATNAGAFTHKEQLGKDIFEDTNLSSPTGMACATCHVASTGFADPDQNIGTSAGVMPRRFGFRNAPTVTYRGAAPEFQSDVITIFAGGMFWDGRAANLVEQAKGPFVNPIEMHNPNHKSVVLQLKKAKYAADFKEEFGQDIFNDVETAYTRMAEAIAAFEKAPEMNKFNSKFDAVIAGTETFTPQEQLGHDLFFDIKLSSEGKPANCLFCHHTKIDPPNLPDPPTTSHPQMTDSRYFNIGIPRNEQNPFYTTIPALNPDGSAFTDLGIGPLVDPASDPTGFLMGAFKVPTLRNIAKTAPYMHNGVFTTLKQVVTFYNTRDVTDSPFKPEFTNNNIFGKDVAPGFIGNIGLNNSEVDALVAFLHTLTDR